MRELKKEQEQYLRDIINTGDSERIFKLMSKLVLDRQELREEINQHNNGLFHKIVTSLLNGYIVNPIYGGYKLDYYFDYAHCIVMYDNKEYTEDEIIDMKRQVFYNTIDREIDGHLYARFKPEEYIKFVQIKQGEEWTIIKRLTAEGRYLCYDDVVAFK